MITYNSTIKLGLVVGLKYGEQIGNLRYFC